MKDAKELLKNLIALPSINPMGRADLPPKLTGESRVAAYVEDFIRKTGADLITQDTGGGMKNVGGMICRGSKKTILLQAHMDTVGIGENLRLLMPEERDGKIYGRGACDDKGSLAAMLSALQKAAQKPAGDYNIIVMAVTDEEYTWAGSRTLVENQPTKDAWLGIVGEPTGCRLVNGYKGVARFALETTGVAAHSSQPERGSNAIYRMGRVLANLEEYSAELTKICDGTLGCETLSVGTISGGEAVNIVPESCKIEIDRRLTRKTYPEEARESLQRHLQERGLDFTLSPLTDAQRAALIEETHPGVQLLTDSCRRAGISPKPITVAFGSDAYRMNNAGIPTLLLGPGSIDVAHTDAEHIPVSELEQAQNFYLSVMVTA